MVNRVSDFPSDSFTGSRELAAMPRYLYALIIVALSMIVYAATLDFPFVWDDFNFIKDNPRISESHSFVNYLTQPELLSKVTDYNDKIYRPLRTWIFAKLYQAVGADPFFYHMLSVVLHTATCVMLFLWLAGWTGKLTFAALTSAFFAVHPIHTEAVSWISSMADPLSALLLFSMLWLLTFPKPFWSLIFGVLFPLALLAKEMSVAAPLLAWFCLQRSSKESRRGFYLRIPYILTIVLAYVLWRSYVLDRIAQVPFTLSHFADCVIKVPYLVWLYVKMIIFPWPQIAYASYVTPAAWQTCLGFLFAFFIAFGSWKWRMFWWRREPWHTAMLASGCFVVSLLPIIGIVPLEIHIAERFVYMPSAFLLTSIVAVMSTILQDRISVLWTKKVSAALVILVLGNLTMLRNEVWSDDLTLAKKNAAVQPPHPMAQWNLVVTAIRERQFDVAADACRSYHALEPGSERLLYLLAVSAMRARQFNIAVDAYRSYLTLAPGNEQLGNAHIFWQLSAAYIGLTKWKDAQAAAEEAIRLDYKSVGGWLNLGVSLKGQGEYQRALQAFDRAIELQPGGHHGYLSRGQLYKRMGEFEKAERDLETARILTAGR